MAYWVQRCFLLMVILAGLVVSNQVRCQQSLSGYLTDSATGRPISGASIICTRTYSLKVLNFAITDIQGHFGFSVNEPVLDSLVIKISHIGFKTETVHLHNNNAQLRIKMVKGEQILPEVTLHADNTGIYRRKDTLDYVTDSFATKNDRVLADVIQKMPGIEISGNQILYQGKPLQKFYVDGLDLMGGRYELINNNLPLEAVQKVQIIENDQPIKILDSLVPSEKASLNVVLKKHETTGSGNAGLGASPLLWDLGLTPMSFFKNFQMINTFQANNTGDPISDQLRDQISQAQNDNFSSDKYVSVIDAGHPPLEEPAWLQNNVKMASSNVLFKTRGNVQWRGYLTYINDVQRNESYNETTMVLPDQSVKVTGEVQNKYYINSITSGLSLEKNEKNILLKDQLSFDEKWNKNEAWDNRDDTTNITQVNNEQLTFISNIFNLTTKIGKQLLGINSSTAYKIMPESLLVLPGQFTSILNNGIPYQQASQRVHFNYFTTDDYFNLVKKVHTLTIDFKGGVQFEKRDLKSELGTSVNQLLPDAFQNNDAFLHLRRYLDPNLLLTIRDWQLNLEIPLSWQVFSNDYNLQSADSTTVRKTTLDPTLGVTYKPDFRWFFSGSVNYKNDFGSQGSLYKGYLLQSFTTLNRSLVGAVSQGNTLSYNFYSTFTDATRALFSNLSLTYTQSYSNFINEVNIDSLGLSVNEMLPVGNNHNVFGAVFNLSKYFHSIKSIVKLKGSLSNGRSDQYLNDSLAGLHSTGIGFSINAINSLLNWLNFEYKFDYNYSVSAYSGSQLSPVTGMNHTLKLEVFPVNNENFMVQANYFTSLPRVASNKLFTNLKYTVTFPKTKTDLSVTINNILNAERYVNQYNYGYTMYYNALYLRPRQILFSVRFNFN